MSGNERNNEDGRFHAVLLHVPFLHVWNKDVPDDPAKRISPEKNCSFRFGFVCVFDVCQLVADKILKSNML